MSDGIAELSAYDIAICILQRLAGCIGPNLMANVGMPQGPAESGVLFVLCLRLLVPLRRGALPR